MEGTACLLVRGTRESRGIALQTQSTCWELCLVVDLAGRRHFAIPELNKPGSVDREVSVRYKKRSRVSFLDVVSSVRFIKLQAPSPRLVCAAYALSPLPSPQRYRPIRNPPYDKYYACAVVAVAVVRHM